MASFVALAVLVPATSAAAETPEDIQLGARATETAIKRLSETGELAKYRVIHFATHGALAGQVSGNSEPGLLLTPPDKATEIDDGYLSAPDIAALKLDADWVILSACNTAAGGAERCARAARVALVRRLGRHGEADNGCNRPDDGRHERRAGGGYTPINACVDRHGHAR